MKNPANKTSPAVAASIVRQYLDHPDTTVDTIASRHGVDTATAFAVLRRAGVKMRSERRMPTLDNLAQAEVELARQGQRVTIMGLARVLGCSTSKVRRLKAERGDLPDVIDRSVAVDWARRYEAGESIRSIAASDHRTYSIVGAALSALNVEIRPRGRRKETPLR